MNLRPSYQLTPYLVCFLACVVVDLFYLPPTTIFPDEHRFLAEAARLAATGQFWVNNDRAWEMPGTALFFAPAVWLFGTHGAVIPLRLAQAVLLLIQVGLIGLIARRVFGNPVVGFIAACIATIYPLLCLHVVVIASLRYRLPFEPLLIILVAEPLAAAWQSLRQRRWRPANS